MIELADKDELINELLRYIEEDSLVILCGAGLSMAAPTQMDSAAAVARSIKVKCAEMEIEVPDQLERQAEYFIERNQFESFFVNKLIDRDTFARPFNQGHEAISDFLLCRAVSATISTNVDCCIEHAGAHLNGQIDGCLNGTNAVSQINRSPLLKIHGCWTLDRSSTIWSPLQLASEPIQSRIANSTQWLNLQLPNKNLLVIGFWSDWSYLNTTLGATLGGTTPSNIIIIDPISAEQLSAKAPDLYSLHHSGVKFTHVQISGSIFLDDLRKAFSRRYIRKAISCARETFIEATGNTIDDDWLTLPDTLNSRSLYSIRKDLDGKESKACADTKEPANDDPKAGYVILRLKEKGAVAEGGYWTLGNKTIRVIKTARTISDAQGRFKNDNQPYGADNIVICTNSVNFNLPVDITDADPPPSFVRQEADSRWLTLQEAQQELGI